MCTYSTSTSLANCLLLRKWSILQTEILNSFMLDQRRNAIKEVTFAVFVRCTAKFPSSHFYWVESSNYRGRTAWVSTATGIDIFYLSPPKTTWNWQVDRQHFNPWTYSMVLKLERKQHYVKLLLNRWCSYIWAITVWQIADRFFLVLWSQKRSEKRKKEISFDM